MNSCHLMRSLDKFLYSKELEEKIKKQLIFAENHGRVKINEWRNFIDYDIIQIIQFALEKFLEENNGTK